MLGEIVWLISMIRRIELKIVFARLLEPRHVLIHFSVSLVCFFWPQGIALFDPSHIAIIVWMVKKDHFEVFGKVWWCDIGTPNK